MRLTIATERIRTGDTLITPERDRERHRLVVHVTVTPERVILECADCSTPILPVGRLVKVERDEVVSGVVRPRVVPGAPRVA